MPDPTIYRYEVPVDDRWHTLELSGDILHVAARSAPFVELWAEANVREPYAWEYRVFGTGHPLPADHGYHVGTALAADGALVWHLRMRKPSKIDQDGGGER